MSNKFFENDLRVSAYILNALNQATVHHDGVWTKSVGHDLHKFVCFYFRPNCIDTQEVIIQADGRQSESDEGWLAFKLEYQFKNDRHSDLEVDAFTLKSLNQFGKFTKKTFSFRKDGTLNASQIQLMLDTILEGFSKEYSRLISRSAREKFFDSLSNIFSLSNLSLALTSHNRLRVREKGGKEITVDSIDDTKPPKESSYQVTISNLTGDEVENLLIFSATYNKVIDEKSSNFERLEHASKCMDLALKRNCWSPLDLKIRDALLNASGDYTKVAVDEYLERDSLQLSAMDYVNVASSLLSSKYEIVKDTTNFQNNLKRSLELLSE